MKMYKFKKEISKKDVEDIMQGAINGCTYWADEMELKENTECLLPLNELLTHDFRIKVHETEEDKWHTLTMKKFLKGLAMMDNHDYYEYDMYDCERVIQYALFGEERYA